MLSRKKLSIFVSKISPATGVKNKATRLLIEKCVLVPTDKNAFSIGVMAAWSISLRGHAARGGDSDVLAYYCAPAVKGFHALDGIILGRTRRTGSLQNSSSC